MHYTNSSSEPPWGFQKKHQVPIVDLSFKTADLLKITDMESVADLIYEI